MTVSNAERLIAVDVGNSRIKLGQFDAPRAGGLPEPVRTLELHARDWSPDQVGTWLGETDGGTYRWSIASVFRDASARLIAWVAAERPQDVTEELTVAQLPIPIRLEAPQRVGIDRLLGAVAANRLREDGRPAVVVDLGSAITVDLISPDGAFAGGAILPGIGMSARALHQETDLLPSVPMDQLGSPLPALGTSTTSAIEAGLYWGAVGAIRELIQRLSPHDAGEPQVFLTGGAAPAVAELLGHQAQYLAHLVLAGIVIAQQTSKP